ncbi:DivIVA domain-containing protein [Protofrankia coriariae]|uniref:Cell wall synthesis protein Wag31 n=1 Tax=Protofrankia coriariae TaxID=1562887 RepID=A0ABR5F6Y9_9ACTN|nr:DivIVA domain-containing protein [Protofrankia coriariae]KLL12393.1 cell division protein DivIVA [Protofrankia coriariae]
MALTPQDVQNKVFSPTRFRTGYNEDEVDAFLDDVESELTRLLDENTDLRRQLDEARRTGGGGSGVPAQVLEENQQLRRQLEETRRQVAQAQAQAAQAVQAAQAAARERPAAQPAAATTVIPAVSPAGAAPARTGNSQLDAEIEQRVARTLVLAQRTADEALREARNESERARREARADADRIIGEARAHVAEQLGGLEDDKRRLEGQVEQLRAFEREYRTRLRAYLEMQLRDLDGMPTQPAVGSGGPSRPPLNPGTGSPPPPPPPVGISANSPAGASAQSSPFPTASPLGAGAMARGNDNGGVRAPDVEAAARRDPSGLQDF